MHADGKEMVWHNGLRRRRGIVGAAITYYLARAGAQVTLLEREQPGRKTSNNSFAWVNAFSRTTRSYYDFARRSVEMYRQLPDELGIDMELHWHGGIHWVDQPEAAQAMQARVRELQSWGHAVEMIGRDDIMAREPHVRPTLTAACYSASDGATHPPSVIKALLQRAQALGVEVRTDQPRRGGNPYGHVTGARSPQACSLPMSWSTPPGLTLPPSAPWLGSVFRCFPNRGRLSSPCHCHRCYGPLFIPEHSPAPAGRWAHPPG